MNQDEKRYISYLCPKCRQSVIVARDLFTLAGKRTLSARMIHTLYCHLGDSLSCSSHLSISMTAATTDTDSV